MATNNRGEIKRGSGVKSKLVPLKSVAPEKKTTTAKYGNSKIKGETNRDTKSKLVPLESVDAKKKTATTRMAMKKTRKKIEK